MKHMFLHYGVPKKIISDWNTRFTLKFAKGLCKSLKIHQNISTAYHPCTDGQSEHTNQWLEQYLQFWCEEEQDNWHKWLLVTEYAHNLWPVKWWSPHLIWSWEYTPTIEVVKKPGMVPWVEECMAELDKIRKDACHMIIKVQKTMKIGNLGNKRFQPYQKGNQVWLEGTNIKMIYPSPKLGLKQHGPFKVLEQLSEAVYQVEIPWQWKIHNMFHANLLMPYKEMELHRPNFAWPPPDLIDGEPEYKVEKILDKKPQGKGHKMHFLIKWKGYPTSDNSWEPTADVLHSW